MEALANLTLSNKEMITSSAKEFITKNASVSECPESGTYILENRKNNVADTFDLEALGNNLSNLIKSENVDSLSNPSVTGKRLAELIEKNSEMFAQLEYVARGTDREDVLNGHVKLMCQILRCHDALWNLWPSSQSGRLNIIEFHKTTPLYHLGLIAATLYMSPRRLCVIVVKDGNVKHLCQFFVDLCHEAGFNIVPLIYSADVEWTFQEDSILEAHPDIGCTGVITERSDLDSAVDVFIRSSESAPWKLKQIYVQESVFENFKLALKTIAQTIAADHILIGNKVFLVENLSSLPGISVQAYRTTKELLSLIKTPYLSLWAANSAESNEIALRTSASIIWVNEYGYFDGPPRAAISIYGSCFSRTRGIFTKDYEELNFQVGSWSKIKNEERLEIVVHALEAADDVDKELLPKFTEEWRPDNLVQVTDKTLCFGVQIPKGIVFSRWTKEKVHQYRIMKTLINGNLVALLNTCHKLTIGQIIKGLPIIEQRMVSEDVTIPVSYPLILENLKIIRTNYGTIFAN